MRKVWAVVRREFVERVRKKSFWVMALLGPVFFAAVFLMPILMTGGGGVKRVVVLDRSTTALGAVVAARLDATSRFLVVGRVPDRPGVEDSLAREVGLKRIDGFVLLSDSLTETGVAEYRASNVSSLEDIALLRETLGRLAERVRLERAGVDPTVVANAQIRVSLQTRKITRGRTTGESAGQSFSLAYFMMLILYVALLLYGVQVMGSVIEEKASRIIEVLISSLKPFQLLLGKLLGVGAVSLVQFAIWGVSGRLLLSQRASLMAGGEREVAEIFQVPHVSGATALVFIAFFLGGFFLYSAMFAAVAATCSTEQEARQSQAPVSILIMIAFFGSFATLANPESRLAVTLSLVPFTSPIATPARWAAGNLTWLDVSTSLALLVAGTVVVMWIAARIYRVGILMTGKRPNLREIVRWVRAG